MNITTFILLIYLVICSNVVNAKIPDAVVGGKICSSQEIRHIVSIQSNSIHICGGSIISKYHILTSASCISFPDQAGHRNLVLYGNLAILSGTHDLYDTSDVHRRVYNVALVIIHPEYNPRKFWINDIAILKLTESIDLQNTRRSVLLPNDLYYKKELMIAGWGGGSLSTGFQLEQHLRKITADRLSRSDCDVFYGRFGGVHGNQRCALTNNVYMEFLTLGDGGSPLMTRTSFIGIVSLISVLKNEPIIYTEVYPYNNWIQQMESTW